MQRDGQIEALQQGSKRLATQVRRSLRTRDLLAPCSRSRRGIVPSLVLPACQAKIYKFMLQDLSLSHQIITVTSPKRRVPITVLLHGWAFQASSRRSQDPPVLCPSQELPRTRDCRLGTSCPSVSLLSHWQHGFVKCEPVTRTAAEHSISNSQCNNAITLSRLFSHSPHCSKTTVEPHRWLECMLSPVGLDLEVLAAALPRQYCHPQP
jgi:hypothetical protein